MTALSIVAGQAKLKPDQQVLLTTQLLPWAVRAGSRCHDLMCLYYETHVDEDLEELRNRWRILVAPKFIEAQKKSAMRSERPPS
jgi:ubiquinone biosynthesis protein COQ4